MADQNVIKKVFIPTGVPLDRENDYLKNFTKITKDKKSCFIFAADHKIEHLNKDFYGDGIVEDASDPEYLFKLAEGCNVGAFATQLGLVSLYGKSYPDVNYLIKLNSKTNLIKTKQRDPLSLNLYSVDDVVLFAKNSGLSIVGIGYTIYLGSEYEDKMLYEAAQNVLKAHQNGLIAVLWIYPRGAAVKNEKDENIIAGAAGVASALGADFVKLNVPESSKTLNASSDSKKSGEMLRQSSLAAGRTKVLCAGGDFKTTVSFLKDIYYQINLGETMGVAVGRNIYQRPFNEAIKLCKDIERVINKEINIDELEKLV